MGRPKGSWTGTANPQWKGGVRRSKGYIFVQMPEHPNAGPTGYVRQHALVMSQHLGRPIAANEVVHHKNEDRTDNRLENLEVMTRSAHHSLHHRGVIKPGSIAALKGHTSDEMRAIWSTTRAHERVELKCLQCGSTFYRRSIIRTRKYCSFSCYNKHRASCTSHG
jgi:HNH endonuclease